MTDTHRIHQLSPQLANQIAAGEVIERPASVVKELLENSLDSGAQQIQIDIEKGGKQLILIQDDGCGIHPDDLPLAVSRHATSKITSLEDLEHVNSLGFRGEALASISAISRFALQSCYDLTNKGFRVQVEGREQVAKIAPIAQLKGTTVEVRDLFFNTPARRKFLRAERTEFSHIEDVVKRIGLSCFDVEITLKHNGRTVLRLRHGTDQTAQENRVAAICGKRFLDQSYRLDLLVEGLRLWGWLGGTDYTRSQADLQYFYVNGRMVRDRLINHAIRQSYVDVIHPGRHVTFVLFLEIDPLAVDVNVHPTKHEVRFRESRLVHDFILRSLRDTLKMAEPETPVGSLEQPQAITSSSSAPAPAYKVLYGSEPAPRTAPNPTVGKAIGLLHKRYILAETPEGLMLVDTTALREQLLKDNLTQALTQKTIQQCPLLLPQTITFDNTLPANAELFSERLTCLGFDMNVVGPETVIVRQVPTSLREVDLTLILKTLYCDGLPRNDTTLDTLDYAQLIAIIAKQGAAQPKTYWGDGEMSLMLASLAQCDASQCQVKFSLDQLATLFSTKQGSSSLIKDALPLDEVSTHE